MILGNAKSAKLTTLTALNSRCNEFLLGYSGLRKDRPSSFSQWAICIHRLNPEERSDSNHIPRFEKRNVAHIGQRTL